jgi:hypothetical protein
VLHVHSTLFHSVDRFLLHNLLRMQVSLRFADVGRETRLKMMTAPLLVLIARSERFLLTPKGCVLVQK